MGHMRPNEFEDLTKQVARRANNLSDLYALCISLAFFKDNSQEVKVKSSGSKDPVGDMVTSNYHTQARKSVKVAAKKLQDAANAVYQAEMALNSLLSERDKQPIRAAEDEPIARTLPKYERERLEQLQKERAERGEKWGL